jgi:hypothetical protein
MARFPHQRRRPSANQSTDPPSAPTTTRVLRSHTRVIAQAIPAATSGRVAKTKPRRSRLDPWAPKRKPSKNPKPRAPLSTHFTCRICISCLPRENFVRWVPPKRSFGITLDVPRPCIPHLARSPYRRNVDPVCKTCIGATMAARLDTLGARRVGSGCLEPGCSEESSVSPRTVLSRASSILLRPGTRKSNARYHPVKRARAQLVLRPGMQIRPALKSNLRLLLHR